MAAPTTLTQGEIAQLMQTIEMFEVITQSQPQDYQSLEILKEAYSKLGQDKEAVGTAKRIAEAYVQIGQLSSAILEYETILQRYPDDPDVREALKEIESKAASFGSDEASPLDVETPAKPGAGAPVRAVRERPLAATVEDGRQIMHKIFVDSKLISTGDFDLCWQTPDLSTTPNDVVEPFIHLLAARAILPVDKSLRVLSDKARMPYLPLEKYETDIELTRKFPAAACRRWCMLPFDQMSKSVMVATANPFNQQAARELGAATPHRLLWYLAPPLEIAKNLRKAFR